MQANTPLDLRANRPFRCPHALGTLVLALNGCSGQVLFDKDISAVLFQRIIGFDDIFFEFG